jgi:hypothetical protein
MLLSGRYLEADTEISVGFVYDEASLSSTEYIVKVQVTVRPADHSRRLFVVVGSGLFFNIKLVVSLEVNTAYCQKSYRRST